MSKRKQHQPELNAKVALEARKRRAGLGFSYNRQCIFACTRGDDDPSMETGTRKCTPSRFVRQSQPEISQLGSDPLGDEAGKEGWQSRLYSIDLDDDHPVGAVVGSLL